jgi:hypothetical protein
MAFRSPRKLACPAQPCSVWLRPRTLAPSQCQCGPLAPAGTHGASGFAISSLGLPRTRTERGMTVSSLPSLPAAVGLPATAVRLGIQAGTPPSRANSVRAV